MDSIQSSSDVPDFARIEARRLISSLNSPETEPQNISVNITAGGSSVIHAFTNLGASIIHQEEEEGESDHTLDVVDLYDEESDEEDKVPSDLSIDHHPHRTCEYTLTFNKSDEEKEEEEEEEEEEKEEEEEEEEEDTIGLEPE
ncbi:hypothetical protein INT47_007505 [Mucor saturninus]|uniref:Uncharacterized protein n=1 Tax=Mucor saturninus TaxID=64648 RepID=A0A8H7R4X6_9FUNG|nr:hypothetical protein INT47_007505 [Mucor saturninus]